MKVKQALAILQSNSASCSSAPSQFRALHTSSARFQLYESVLHTIGRTPVVKANKVLPPKALNNGIQLYCKLEYFNPLSSVKDRLAIAIIEDAERSGELKEGMTVVEATSGNTGISLAMVCANKGYPFVAVMAEPYSVERRKIMRALGAKVVITPTSGSGTGMLAKAKELSATHGWFLARQFENKANAAYHANTTGPEILIDFQGKNLDYWVTGYGTGGTFTGAAKVLKQARPEVKILLAEPSNAALVSSNIPQERNADGSPGIGHPKFTPHPIQGWTPNFIPKVCQEGLDLKLHDSVEIIDSSDAIATAKELAIKEGIFTGISGGASAAVAIRAAQSAPKGSVILAMLPDTQERYQSTILYNDIQVDMNEEEMRISKSTPSFQLETNK